MNLSRIRIIRIEKEGKWSLEYVRQQQDECQVLSQVKTCLKLKLSSLKTTDSKVKPFERELFRCFIIVREAEGTKVHVYLPYPGAISFYVYFVSSGLINIFLDVECDKISCRLQPTRFFWIFYKTVFLTKKAKFQICFVGKIIYVIKKVIKNHIWHIIMITFIPRVVVQLWARLKPYFQTSDQEISAI